MFIDIGLQVSEPYEMSAKLCCNWLFLIEWTLTGIFCEFLCIKFEILTMCFLLLAINKF